ncbi:MAG TPA: hypothetical protein DGG95_06085 [Cytophagales bacterium]|nr:hypothetical protein [Cytophagales bacterium]
MLGVRSIFGGINWREFAPVLVIVANSLIWYASTYSVFSSQIEKLDLDIFIEILLFGVFFAAIAVSAFIGGWLFPRQRKIGLASWIVFGAIMTLALVTIPSNNLYVNFILSLLLGLSVGMGLPSTLAYFADVTRITTRGFLGGITWCTFGFGVLAVVYLVNIVEPTLGLELLALWRIVGLLLFLALVPKKQESIPKKSSESYRRILARRDIILYLIPWTMFSIVNFAESPIAANVLGDSAELAGFITFALSGIFAIIGGVLADRVGRKRIVIAGFVIFGIEYAVLSLFSDNPFAQAIYIGFDSAAWGMFAAVFFMTLWGDLSEAFQKEKYYVLGGLPYLFLSFLPILINPFKDSIQAPTAFSIASFFLFVAVLPLIYAPETLPEKMMKDRDLKSYIDKAKRIAEKESEKDQKQQTEQNENQEEDSTKETEESPEDKKARELAEKYY